MMVPFIFIIASGFERGELITDGGKGVLLVQNIDYFSALGISKPGTEVLAVDFSAEPLIRNKAQSSGLKKEGVLLKLWAAIMRTFRVGREESEEYISGHMIKLSDFRGKVVFLNFWATWCGPCRAEVKDIDKLYDTLKDEGFTVMAVDIGEDRRKVESFMKKNNINFPVYLDSSGAISANYGVTGIPTTFIIDPDGKIIGRAIGPRPWGSYESIEFMRSLMKK